MNEESIKKHKENIQHNCGNCIHDKVCSYKDAYNNVVSRVMREAQADSYLIEVLCKCKYYAKYESIKSLDQRCKLWQIMK